MKLRLIIIFLISVSLTAFLAISIPAWNTETVDGIVKEVGNYSSMAINSTDDIHIGYYNGTDGDLMHAWYDNLAGTWHTETVDDGAGKDVGKYTSIATNSTDDLHISYQNSTNGDLMHAWYDYGAHGWHTETVEVGGVGLAGKYTSIAINSTDDIHISYGVDTAIGDRLSHAFYDTNVGTWTTELVDTAGGIGFTMGLYNSIAINSTDDPHISYQEAAIGTHDLLHAWYNTAGSAWVTETVDATGVTGLYTSIDINSTDVPHISYYDSTNDDLLHAWYNAAGSAWVTEIVDPTDDIGQYTSITIDSSDILHISYYDNTNDNLKHAWYDGTWNTETVEAGGDVGWYTSIAVNSTDVVHVSYYDNTNGDLKHAESGDFIPPTRSIPVPTNGSSFASSTTAVILGLTTNEIAECRYSTVAGTAFAAMIAFANTDALVHTTAISTRSGETHNLFIKCSDVYDNTNPTDYQITFSVAAVVTSEEPRSTNNAGPAPYLKKNEPTEELVSTNNDADSLDKEVKSGITESRIKNLVTVILLASVLVGGIITLLRYLKRFKK